MHNTGIIAVRPRVGSALERLYVQYQDAGVSMKEAVHVWAEQAESRCDPIIGGKEPAKPITSRERVGLIAAHRKFMGSTHDEALAAVRSGWRG